MAGYVSNQRAASKYDMNRPRCESSPGHCQHTGKFDQVDCYLVGPGDDAVPGILDQHRSDHPVTAGLRGGMHRLPPANSLDDLNQQLEAAFGLSGKPG